MTTRTCRKLMTFEERFLLRAIDAVLPPGTHGDLDTPCIDCNEERHQPHDPGAAFGTGSRLRTPPSVRARRMTQFAAR
jgi:hypothetical protein